MVILSFWIHELGLGGRSKLVQNILYLVVCFFLMRPYINACITKKIIFRTLFKIAIPKNKTNNATIKTVILTPILFIWNEDMLKHYSIFNKVS